MGAWESRRFLSELANLGSALEAMGASLQRTAAAAAEACAEQVSPAERVMPDEEYAVRLLWTRLGSENRKLLYQTAKDFEPGDTFTLEELARGLSVSKGSIRARMMNLGRSMKALGGRAPDLWDVDWDGDAGVNLYEWRPASHRAILRIVEG